MNLPILDQKNPDEQPYYPPSNYECIPENNKVEEDDYFVDETIFSSIDNKRNNCFKTKIIRKNINTYIIREFDYIKYLIIASFIISFLFPVLFFITLKIDLFTIIMSFVCILIICVNPIIFGFCYFHLIYLDFEPNSIILTKKAMFTKKIIVYNMGELERAEICYKYIKYTKGYNHTFKLYFVRKTGEKEEFHCFGVLNLEVNIKGIIYFIDLVNEHIKKHMN